MASTHILATGTIRKGHTSLRVAPHNPVAAAELDAYLEQSIDAWCSLHDDIEDAAQVARWHADTDDYEQEMLDREDWARGGW